MARQSSNGGGNGCAISVTCARGGPSRIYFTKRRRRRSPVNIIPVRAIKQKLPLDTKDDDVGFY